MSEVQNLIDLLLELPEEELRKTALTSIAYNKGKKWLPNLGPQSDAYHNQADELYYGGQAGGGKALVLTSSRNASILGYNPNSKKSMKEFRMKYGQYIMTPFGQKLIDDVKEGDAVINPDGTTAEIIKVHDTRLRESYRFTFSDGVETVVSDDHLWSVKVAGKKTRNKIKNKTDLSLLESPADKFAVELSRRYKTRTTTYLYAEHRRQQQREKNGQKPFWFHVPLTEPVNFQFPSGRTKMAPPYALGIFLGDGWCTGTTPVWFKPVPEIAERMSRELETIGDEVSHHAKEGSYGIVNGNFYACLKSVKLNGMRAWEKFIPKQYLLAPIDNRWALMQGLMDSDGYVSDDGKAYYCTTSPRLRDDFCFLARSLGFCATPSEKMNKNYPYKGEILTGRDAYDIYITGRNMENLCSANPFKFNRLKEKRNEGGRRIVSIEKLADALESRCITVSHPNGLYLTNDFIVTHNSDLGLGLSLVEHQNSLILRRFNDDARKLAERMMEITGTRDGYNGQYNWYKTDDGRRLDFGGMKEEKDKQRYKGTPHDFIFWDEIPDFLESQYRFVIAWNRSVNPDQRCRVICAGNPPTEPEGVWVIKYWGPWLDPSHPNPAEDGELRWYTSIDGIDQEVDGPGPHMINGEEITARSRTFMRSKLSDNPDLADTNYDSVLAALPEEYRMAYREGRFDVSLKDQAFQVIPTSWLQAAKDRWESAPPRNVPMCAIGCDIAQGGPDKTVLAIRHDGWFAKMDVTPGENTPDGASVAGLVTQKRKHGAAVVVDMGGGYGASAKEHLEDNGIKVVPYKGAAGISKKSEKGNFGFVNIRAYAYWKLREALDPSEYQGSPIAFPDDPLLISDLSAPTFQMTKQGIRITPKEDLAKKLGRSPDRGDAVVMAWFAGATAKTHIQDWRPDQRVGNIGGAGKRRPQVNTSAGKKRRRRA